MLLLLVPVIDFCLTKVLMCDPETSYTSLQLQWASKANCIQRRGRAGRVSDGRAYHLVTKDFFMQLSKFSIPEMERCPLDLVVLNVKRLDIGEPKAILGLALDPPALDDIEQTVLKLKEIGALTSLDMEVLNPHDGQLTFLGHVMAELPIDVRLGKLILLGHVFGLLEACMIISASLSMKCFFSTPFRAHLEAYRSVI
ncbi:hypothetical protein LSH36_561g03033 [Paralvinella palmiformis]|uniref:Helicase-associated domain-containing protein n=1 Tax=Paralvinella palmiformis TaxID=53620 RepID=A0AAD9J782_9ANNE|nr:hypothetical protein LSH36_561g03033 [Paralvinella palmiformis]